MQRPYGLFSWLYSLLQDQFASNSRRPRYTASRNELPNTTAEMSASQSLYEEICDSMELSDDSSARFLPANCLKKLLRKEVVEAVLKPHELNFGTTKIDTLVQFVIYTAPKAFATLAWSGKVWLINQLHQAGFRDEMLPVVRQDSKVSSSRPDFTEVVNNAFSSDQWDRWAVNNFCDSQWVFLAQVFRKDQFRYNIPKPSRMPFLQKGSGTPNATHFSEVEEWIIHRDNLQTDINVPLNEGGQPRLAVKELKKPNQWLDEDFKKAAENEAGVFERMKRSPHPHFVEVIAYYEKGERHYFLFPWAEAGNLREHWTTTTPKLEQGYLQWVFAQLTGLAGAIQLLHDNECRHGDLKPENILCFRGAGNGDPSYPERLVIADLGLAKVHRQQTELRNGATTTMSATVMYAPPEAELNMNEPRSRLYDIWSIGCMYLEFSIWLLFRDAGLKEFQQAIGGLGHRGTFYIIQAGQEPPARVHPEVDTWVKAIRDHPRCSDGTALRRLIDLIATKLLVIALPKHGPAELEKTSNSKPDSISPASDASPVFKLAVRNATFKNESIDDQPTRANAQEMHNDLEGILGDIVSRRCKVIGESTSQGELPRSGGTLGVPSGTHSAGAAGVRDIANDYMFTALHDNWEYIPDNDFAREVFADLDSSPALPPGSETSALCPRCSDLDLWSPMCSFFDTLAGLAEKAGYCALCGLLLSWNIQSHVGRDDNAVKFFRVGSYLTCSNGRGQPITSLYTLPGSRSPYLQRIQIGFPRLPDAGSPTHISILAKWISTCNNMHKCYPRDLAFFPTRVIDVGNNNSGTVRLLCETGGLGRRGKYLVLSHRWGLPGQHRTFSTKKRDIEGKIERTIKITDLPKTFRDAVRVTRNLRVPYLWIDSLCIIQDDTDDWNKESKLMELVFSSAYCTIAATCASGTDDGFLKPRPERQYITMKGPGIDAPYYLCEAIDDFGQHVDQSELNRRGWVLQERALSRRTIYFTETQTYWECGGGVRCETLTKMKNQKASFLGDSNFPHSAEDYVKGKKIKLFQDLYMRYSNMALTRPEDRPVAVKGLEARLIQTFGGTGGYGIFQIYLHRCLLWEKSGSSMKSIESFPSGPVPSWSWMAYEGGIRYIDAPGKDVEWQADVTWPFSKFKAKGIDASSGSQQSNNNGGVALELEAPIWDLVEPLCEDMPLDDGSPITSRPCKCVVIGVSKLPAEEEYKRHYVLIVGHDRVDNVEVWKRLGVGIMERRHIALDGPKTMARIQ